VLYNDDTASSDPDSVEFFACCAVGHTVALSDYSSAVTQSTVYEAFGQDVAQSGTSNTKERDASLGLDNDGFRYYDPATGRYIQRDPIGFKDGMNVYQSVHNNPVNSVDPLGLEADPWHHQAAKSVFDAADEKSTIDQRNITLDDGIGIHSKEYGWSLDKGAHSKLHSNTNPFGARWEKAQKDWVESLPENTHITKDMLDEHLSGMRQSFGLTDAADKALIGAKATEDWGGVAAHYNKLDKDARLLAANMTAPDRASESLMKKIADTAPEGTLTKLGGRAAKMGRKLAVPVALTVGVAMSYQEARADGAPMVVSGVIAVGETVNPTPFSAIEVKNAIGAKLSKVRDSAKTWGDERGDGIGSALSWALSGGRDGYGDDWVPPPGPEDAIYPEFE
jgi:RHS repeat-associated protein